MNNALFMHLGIKINSQIKIKFIKLNLQRFSFINFQLSHSESQLLRCGKLTCFEEISII